MAGHQQLKVWQEAIRLSGDVYRLTSSFPRSEQQGLVDQMRRSSVSISSNIAEGSRRVHRNEKRQFYSIAYGSAAELDSQIRISIHAGFIRRDDVFLVEDLVDHVLRLIHLLLKKFR